MRPQHTNTAAALTTSPPHLPPFLSLRTGEARGRSKRRSRRRSEKKEEEKEAIKLAKAAIPSATQRDKWRVLASKKGFAAGLPVEAPLMHGGSDLEFEGSWFSASIIDCGQKSAKVVFEPVEGLPECPAL